MLWGLNRAERLPCFAPFGEDKDSYFGEDELKMDMMINMMMMLMTMVMTMMVMVMTTVIMMMLI